MNIEELIEKLAGEISVKFDLDEYDCGVLTALLRVRLKEQFAQARLNALEDAAKIADDYTGFLFVHGFQKTPAGEIRELRDRQP